MLAFSVFKIEYGAHQRSASSPARSRHVHPESKKVIISLNYLGAGDNKILIGFTIPSISSTSRLPKTVCLSETSWKEIEWKMKAKVKYLFTTIDLSVLRVIRGDFLVTGLMFVDVYDAGRFTVSWQSQPLPPISWNLPQTKKTDS